MGTKAVGGANGKHGRVRLYSSDPVVNYEFCITEWSLTENVQEEDTTNSCSEGKREFEYGAKWVEGTLTIDLDLSQHPLDDPPNFQVGQKLTPLEFHLYEHVSSSLDANNTHWALLDLAILSVQVTAPAASKVIYVISFKTGNYFFRIQPISQ